MIFLRWIASILIDKGLKALVDYFKYLSDKKQRDKTLEKNQKELQDALKSKDDNAIKNASEHSLNND